MRKVCQESQIYLSAVLHTYKATRKKNFRVISREEINYVYFRTTPVHAFAVLRAMHKET
jgi:hypothetical protein